MARGLTKMLAIQLICAVDEMYLHGKNLLDKQCDDGADAQKRAESNASRRRCTAGNEHAPCCNTTEDEAAAKTYIYV